MKNNEPNQQNHLGMCSNNESVYISEFEMTRLETTHSNWFHVGLTRLESTRVGSKNDNGLVST